MLAVTANQGDKSDEEDDENQDDLAARELELCFSVVLDRGDVDNPTQVRLAAGPRGVRVKYTWRAMAVAMTAAGVCRPSRPQSQRTWQ